MSEHFRGKMNGLAGRAGIRVGTKASGLTASIYGSTLGVVVEAFWDEEKQRDVFVVSKTGGIGNSHIRKVLGTYWLPIEEGSERETE